MSQTTMTDRLPPQSLLQTPQRRPSPLFSRHLRSSDSQHIRWTELARLRTFPDQKLISPAIASDFDWLREFFNLLPSEARPDYLNVHVYTTTFDSFRSTVERYWHEFGLPLVVSEFAMQSFDPNVIPPQTQQQVHDFMGQVTKWLDETEYVFKYSWFGAVIDPANLHGVHLHNRLMDEQGEITPLGRQYICGGHA
ncbi:hypothetical protein P7C73_g3252, partial [Tremellales sp. Uapishka_1]